MNIPKRLPYELVIIAGLMLGSCKPAWEDRLDVADVNARNAIYRVNELESRVDELERQANELESRLQ
ncbi:hypothetical protein AOA14_20015 (plasmid) [Sphingopyxis terrae subsp. terrae NBRC 15098]|uniref:Uncharacterized protein n=1 Tax=Sphingopyxis terrae subsp. terrae NBRC 15098 TaxID=1219058 RepID=A0A142W3Z0_9SPHN|nr:MULTISPECIES: hypothetical protein [Sphingopyxis]AMU96689.1 hypothetical protein AOA14_20015 [Sphingopyxis terrae subsp. terrae NBRC 15098]